MGVRLVAEVLLRVEDPIRGVRVVGEVVLPPPPTPLFCWRLLWPGWRVEIGVRTPDLTAVSPPLVVFFTPVEGVLGAPRGLLFA